MNFILGVLFVIIIENVGFSGIAKVLDSGVNKTKSVVEKIEVDKN